MCQIKRSGRDNIVKIKKSPVAIKLVQLGDKDYYELWRRKLSWGKRESRYNKKLEAT